MNCRVLFAAAVLLAALTAPSCRFLHRSAKAKTPPAPPPAAEPIPAPAATLPEPADQQVALPAPPSLPPGEPTLKPPAASSSQNGKQLPPPPRRRRRSVPAETASAPPVATVPPEPAAAALPAPPPAALPQLQQLLTPEQQQAYNEEIDRNVERAQKTVAVLLTHKLNDEQATYLDRIRTFLKQAGDARKTDLFRARNLAQRASVLADDLLRSVQ